MTECSISVIVPAYNARRFLERSLPPLIAMHERGKISEVLVADDSSIDDGASFAENCGAKVIRLTVNSGPAAARNRAAEIAQSDILWFVDADVVAHETGPDVIRQAFADRSVTAIFGSYDDDPPERNFASRYKNLTHRYYHLRASSDAMTFWAGCGAVRRDAFLALGGFDERLYRTPSVEDIELGARLRATGARILTLPALLGTHLKYWSIPQVIAVDIRQRALPWSRLILRRGLPNTLNLSWPERLRALLAVLFLASLAGTLAVPHVWPVALLSLGAVLGANFSYFRFMSRFGVAFGAASLIFHQIYYVYSTGTFAYCLCERFLTPAT